MLSLKEVKLPKVNPDFLAIFLLIFLGFTFFWKFFLKGLLPIPADVIVGIYYPWRDHIWNNLAAGVPFKNGHLSDVVSIIYPWRLYGIEILKQGIWPLWIPHALAGMPLLANFQSAIFYPLNFLFWIFSGGNAWSLYIVLQPILASLFAFLFLRNLRLSRMASLFGAIIFAFSGFSLVWLEYGIVGHAGLWLPLALLSVDKFKGKAKFLWLAIGSFALGFSFLAGYPQISLFSSGVVFLYATYRVYLHKNFSYLLGCLNILLGLSLAAIQLVPGVELWTLSIRQSDLTVAAFGHGLLPLQNLVLVLIPDFFGNPSTGNFWAKLGYNESAFYVGLAGLIFALLAIFSKQKETFFFKILLLFSLIFAFRSPLANLLPSLNLPGLSTASAGRWLFLTTFSLSVLASFGVDLFLNLKRKRLLFLLSLFILAIFGALWLLVLSRQENINFQIAKRNLILPTLMFLGVAFLLFSSLIVSKLKNVLVSVVFLLLVFDLFRFGWKYNSFSPKEYLYPPTKLTSFLQEKAGLDRFYGLVPQSMFIPYNLSSIEGYEPLMPRRFNELANQINETNFKQISTGSRWVIVNRHESPLLNWLGVKYLLSFNFDPKKDWDPQYFRYPQEKYRLLFQYGYSQVYENKEALPRAFIVHDFQVLRDEEILKTLMDKNFDPKKTLLLEEKPDRFPLVKVVDDKAIIDEAGYFRNQVIINTSSVADGFLFLSDNYYPGWQSFVDGQETKIYRANYTFRAVFVPAGEHEVKFLFQPQSFKIGAVITFLTLVLLGGLFIYDKSKKRLRAS